MQSKILARTNKSSSRVNGHFYATVMLFYCWCLNPLIHAQTTDTLDIDDFQIVVDLDVYEVTANRSKFDVADFIDLVRSDKSFYKAFQNIRFLSYESSNSITFSNSKAKQKAAYSNIIQQNSDGKCREMEILSEEVSGNFYKKKKQYRYYTAKMLDRLFFTHGKQCGDRVEVLEATPPNSKMEQYVTELKKLIFSPGEAADIPFLGKKLAIFEPKMSRFYNFEIQSQLYQGTIDCYVFSAQIKPEFIKKSKKTVIKSLHTYFDKSTFQVVARNYRLAYANALYDFDVTIAIELVKIGKKYVPTHIQYDGHWDIQMKKSEISTFNIEFWDYENGHAKQ